MKLTFVKNYCMSKKYFCYMCTNESMESTTTSASDEHIIQNSIGGHLSSKKLICEYHNTSLFKKNDQKLRDALSFFIKKIDFKTERTRAKGKKHKPYYFAVDEKGFPHHIDENRVANVIKYNPIMGYDSTNKTFIFPENDSEKKLKWLQKYKGYTDEQIKLIMKDAKKIPSSINMEVEIGLNFSPSFLKAVTKIATNFYIYKGGIVSNITEPIKYLNNDGLSEYKMGYFYPKENMIYDIGKEEISHILYLRGDPSQRLLYCYIELFNCHCFIVPLNCEYEGNEITEQYIWDLKLNKKLDKKIQMNVYRADLINRNYEYFNVKIDDFEERFIHVSDRLKWGFKKLGNT
jgi:HNH endonuclease